MTINVYTDYRDEDGNIINNRTKLFISAVDVDEDGHFKNFQSGLLTSPISSGYFYIVDAWIIHQIEKIKVEGGVLVVKDGETLQQTIKSPLEIEEENLLRRMAEIQAVKQKQLEPAAPPAISEPSKVDINTADILQLTTLEGIGEKKAQTIINYRDENGMFEQTADITNVPGTGQKTYERLEPFITV